MLTTTQLKVDFYTLMPRGQVALVWLVFDVCTSQVQQASRADQTASDGRTHSVRFINGVCYLEAPRRVYDSSTMCHLEAPVRQCGRCLGVLTFVQSNALSFSDSGSRRPVPTTGRLEVDLYVFRPDISFKKTDPGKWYTVRSRFVPFDFCGRLAALQSVQRTLCTT
jgi:hypothetical protein